MTLYATARDARAAGSPVVSMWYFAGTVRAVYCRTTDRKPQEPGQYAYRVVGRRRRLVVVRRKVFADNEVDWWSYDDTAVWF